ncbi:MAG: RCC1 domain-containing protein, partial [Actinomycetota bacterium]|nr:RCC1 domain-containing protein [Actinomycetota bacterium]
TTTGNQGSATPVQVVGVGGTGLLSGVAKVVSDGYVVGGTICALLTSGNVDCWGYGAYGQLGNGSFTTTATPVQVVGIGGTGLLSGVAQVVSDGSSSSAIPGTFCALLTSGNVDCWGYDAPGELGKPTGSPGSATPVQVVKP